MAMHAEVEAKGVDFAIAVFPELTSLDEAYPFAPAHAAIRGLCAEEGVRCIDLFESYRGHEASSLWVHPTDHHPNEIAHQIAADRIGEEVRNYLLSD